VLSISQICAHGADFPIVWVDRHRKGVRNEFHSQLESPNCEKNTGDKYGSRVMEIMETKKEEDI